MKNKVLFGLSLMVIFLSGCSKQKDELLLDCIIERYSSFFSLKEGKALCIIDVNDWSDSTSLLRVLTMDKEDIPNGYYLETKYGNSDVLYSIRSASVMKSEDSINFPLIPSKMNWTKVKQENSAGRELGPPEEFHEVQIVYNSVRHCIDTTLISKNFHEFLTLNCASCD